MKLLHVFLLSVCLNACSFYEQRALQKARENDAIAEYQKFLENYPDSKLRPQAEEELLHLYYVTARNAGDLAALCRFAAQAKELQGYASKRSILLDEALAPVRKNLRLLDEEVDSQRFDDARKSLAAAQSRLQDLHKCSSEFDADLEIYQQQLLGKEIVLAFEEAFSSGAPEQMLSYLQEYGERLQHSVYAPKARNQVKVQLAGLFEYADTLASNGYEADARRVYRRAFSQLERFARVAQSMRDWCDEIRQLVESHLQAEHFDLGLKADAKASKEKALQYLIEQGQQDAIACYRRAFESGGDAQGQIVLSATVNASGLVSEIAVARSTSPELYDVATCTADYLWLWHYPSSAEGLRIEVPYRFGSGQD